jgi:hypothetical protein
MGARRSDPPGLVVALPVVGFTVSGGRDATGGTALDGASVNSREPIQTEASGDPSARRRPFLSGGGTIARQCRLGGADLAMLEGVAGYEHDIVPPGFRRCGCVLVSLPRALLCRTCGPLDAGRTSAMLAN